MTNSATMDLDSLINGYRQLAAENAAMESELATYRSRADAGDTERHESWDKIHRSWCEAMASDRSVTAGAQWLGLAMLCWAKIDHAGHAPIGRSEIMSRLGISNLSNLYKVMSKAKARRLIDESSTIDCLVAPDGLETSDPKVRRRSCRYDH